MDLNQAGSGQLPGRIAAFNDGVNGTPSMVASGLAEQSAMFNSQVPGRFTPHSVLQQYSGMSGNGMSAEDAQRLLPGGGTMMSTNGISQDNYQAASMMRLMGNRGA